MTCREWFTQSRNNIFESEFFSHCLEDTLIAFSISLSTFYISVGFEAQTELRIFFVTDTNINKLHQRLHDGLCFFFRPEFLTEVEVNRYRNAMAFCSFTSQFCQFGCLIGDSGSDTGPVEPIGTFHDCIKIEVSCIRFSNGRMCTVIDYFAGTHRSTCFKIVDTYAVATTGNEICFYTIFAQCVHSWLTDFVFRQFSHKVSVMSIVGTADSYICFTTTIYYVKWIRLNKTGISRSGQSQHDLA